MPISAHTTPPKINKKYTHIIIKRMWQKWKNTLPKTSFCCETFPADTRPVFQQIIERVLKWNTFTPADEGSTKAAKKHLSLCFLFASAARSRLFASFSRKSECSRFLFSLTSLSSFLSSRVFFLKSGRKSICWRCFFHSRTHERFPPQNHSQTTSSYISLYSHWRTTNTITTHISFITRGGAQTQTRVFAAAAAAALSLSLALLLFERKRARKVPFF